jgi:hypothetical protein
METEQPHPPSLVRIYVSLLPEEASAYPCRLKTDADWNVHELETLWNQVRRKWGFSITREVMQDQPDKVQLRITQVDVSKPAHRAGLMNGDVIYQLYGCCTNPPLQLLFGLMRDSSAFEYVSFFLIYGSSFIDFLLNNYTYDLIYSIE